MTDKAFKNAHEGKCAGCGQFKKVISNDDNLCFQCFCKQESMTGFPSLKQLFKK